MIWAMNKLLGGVSGMLCRCVGFNYAGIRLVCHAKGAETGEETDGKKKRVLVMGGTGRVGGSTLRALSKGGDLHVIVGGRNRYHTFPCCIPASFSLLIIGRICGIFLLLAMNLNRMAFREKGEALARELGGNVEFLGFDMDDPSALRAAIDGLQFCTWLDYNSAFQAFCCDIHLCNHIYLGIILTCFGCAGVDLVVHAAGPFQRRPECAVLEAAIDTRVPFFEHTAVGCLGNLHSLYSCRFSVILLWLKCSTLEEF